MCAIQITNKKNVLQILHEVRNVVENDLGTFFIQCEKGRLEFDEK